MFIGGGDAVKKGPLGPEGREVRTLGTDTEPPGAPAPAAPSSRMCIGCIRDKRFY